jgi:diadenosine tetraphosphatase ApaH/serine/threonine PP2A family protein phosphatase
MRIALLADIHANRQAFAACLARARAQGARRFALLGDFVGYGADPDWTVTTVMDLVGRGAAAVLGNHDRAVGRPSEHLTVEAQIAIEWTRGQLDAAQRRFLAALPLTAEEDGRLLVHASADRPERWPYVTDAGCAAASFAATAAWLTFCGHVHVPVLYSLSAAAKLSRFVPTPGVAVPLLPGRRWLAVLGSVGQPRDGNPAAAFAMFDTTSREITYCRVPYDVEAAAKRIRGNGLPAWLADRLLVGR